MMVSNLKILTFWTLLIVSMLLCYSCATKKGRIPNRTSVGDTVVGKEELVINKSESNQLPSTYLFPVKVTGRWGYINEHGKIKIEPKFELAYDFSEEAAAVILDGKYGFINTQGGIIIEPKFDDIGDFKCGLAVASIRNRNDEYLYGYINKDGMEVIPFIYDEVPSEFSKEVIIAKKKFPLDNDSIFLINKSGKIIYSSSESPSNYRSIGEPSEGLILVKIEKKYGYIDYSGNVVIKPNFDFGGDFKNGLAFIKKGSKYGFINKNGKEVIKAIYEDTYGFSEGLATIKINGKYGIIDTTGKIVITPIYDNITTFKNGYARIIQLDKLKNKRYGLIDRNGNSIVSIVYDNLDECINGMIAFKINGRWGYLNCQGVKVIDEQFDWALRFNDDLAMVKKDNKIGFIDKQGKFVVNPIYDSVDNFKDGLAGVYLLGNEYNIRQDTITRKGYVNKTGELVWPPTN